MKDVTKSTPLNLVHMSIKELYKFVLERNVTNWVIDIYGRMEPISSKLVEREPTVFWSKIYILSRRNGLSLSSNSLFLKLIHTLLPSKESINHLSSGPSPHCVCIPCAVESYAQLFY